MKNKIEKKALLEMIKYCFGNSDEDKVNALIRRCDIISLDKLISTCGIDGVIYSVFCQPKTKSILPAKIESLLYQRAGIIGIRNTLIKENLAILADEFNKNDIDYIILKGIPLSQRVYPSDHMRLVSDIDILINRDQYQKIDKILDNLGYAYPEKQMRSISDTWTKEWIEQEKREISFIKKDIPFDICVDLHFSMDLFHDNKKMNSLFPVGDYDWFNNIRYITSDKVQIPCLDDELEFIYSIYHYAIQHTFMGPKWLVDICYMISGDYPLEIEKAFSMISTSNLKNAVIICLSVVSDVLGKDIFKGHTRDLFSLEVPQIAYENIIFEDCNSAIGKVKLKFYKLRFLTSFRQKIQMLKYYLFQRSSIKHRIVDDGRTKNSFFQPFKLLIIFIEEIRKNNHHTK